MYRDLRDHDPVHHVEDGDFWVLSQFQHVFDAARDTDTFSSAQGLTWTYDEREKIGLDSAASPIVMMDPPDHTEFRRLVGRGFTPRQVSEIEPAVREFVRDRIKRLRASGGGDIIAELYKPMPSFVVAHYLGVPESDRGRFDGWTEAIVAANASGTATSGGNALSDLLGFFTELIAYRRTDPGDDMISALVTSDLGTDDIAMLKILGFAFTMVTGGNDTTTGLLGGATEMLARHPDQRSLLAGSPDLIPGAVEEFLRLTSPVQGLARFIHDDVTIDGTTIPADRKVLLLYASANRDPREYGDDAGELDVTRDVKRQLAFSYGAHHCIGAAAARLQARVALEEVLLAFPHYRVDSAAARWAPGNFVRRYESLPFSAN
jgi:cytochrome P450